MRLLSHTLRVGACELRLLCDHSRIFIERMQVDRVNIQLSYAPPAAAGGEVTLPAGAELPRIVQVRACVSAVCSRCAPRV